MSPWWGTLESCTSTVCGKYGQRSMHFNHGHTRVSPIVKAVATPLVIAYAGFMLGMTAVDGHPEVALVIVAGYVSLLFTGIKARIKAHTSGTEAGLPSIYSRCIAILLGFIFLTSAMTATWAVLAGKPPIDGFVLVGVATGAATAAMVAARRFGT